MSAQSISPSLSPSQKPTKPDLHMDFSTLPRLIQPSPPSNTLLITVRPNLSLRHDPSLTFPSEPSLPHHIHPVLVISNPRPRLCSRPALLIFSPQIFPTDHRFFSHRPSRHHHPPVLTQLPLPTRQPRHPHLLWRTHSDRYARSTSTRAPQQEALFHQPAAEPTAWLGRSR